MLGSAMANDELALLRRELRPVFVELHIPIPRSIASDMFERTPDKIP